MLKNVIRENINILALHAWLVFSVEQLTKSSPIEMVCGISRMKSRKREQLSVSYVLMKSLSSVSTTEFGRFSWLVVRRRSRRWVTFIVKFSIWVSETGHLFQLLYMSMFSGGNRRERVQLHNCMFICMCVRACTCMMHFVLPCSGNITYKICPRCWVHAGVIYQAW